MHRVSSLTAYPLGDTVKYKSCSAEATLSAANGETPKLNQVISGWIENNGTVKRSRCRQPQAGRPVVPSWHCVHTKPTCFVLELANII